MKKLIIPILALVLASCAKEQQSETLVVLPGQEITITATSGDPETRTERASDGSVLWSPGDQISLFYGSGADGGSCFTAQNTETAKVANFTGTIGVITGGNDVSVEDTYFWATYPYNATASCDGASVTTVLPSEQVATADTFADDLFPSIGRSQGLNMAFYNICGGLKFTVSEEGIKSVTLKGKNGEQIAGRITVGFGEDERPVVTGIADGSETITVSAPAGETFEVGRAYYIVLVPTTFENGFTLTFSKGYAEATYERAKKTTIKRSSFGTLTTPDAGLEWTMLYVQIPDENFRAYMVQRFDTNGNGVLDFDEAEAVKSIDIYQSNITSLEGVEFCKNLTYLKCGSNQLTSLDVSHNTELTYLSCSSNQLTSLDVSQNTALEELFCYNNQLTSLDVSQNTALTYLNCRSNRLTSLDVSKNTSLIYFGCSSNQLTSLDVTHNTALQDLSCYNNQLTSLDVSQNTALTNLSCGNNPLTSLDVSHNTALRSLLCYNNQLTSLDVSQNTALTQLSCHSNQLTSLDVSQNTLLTDLRCYNNQLTSLGVSQNTALTYLNCNSNQLTSLDVSKNTALNALDASPMNDAFGNNLLSYLYVHQGQIIPNITSNRSVSYVPYGTIIMAAPQDGESEGTLDEILGEDISDNRFDETGAVLYSDDFEWVAPWASAAGAGDAVATNNPSTAAPNVFTSEACNGFIEAFAERGYAYLWGASGGYWSDSLGEDNPKVLYLQSNYLKFGKTDYNAALKLPAINSIEGATDVLLCFDWARQTTTKYLPDIMSLSIDIEGGGAYYGLPIVFNEYSTGEGTIVWQHAQVFLEGIGPESRIIIHPTHTDPSVSNPDRRQNRWYIDNVKLIAK